MIPQAISLDKLKARLLEMDKIDVAKIGAAVRGDAAL